MASIYKRGDNYYLDYSNSKFITPTNPQGRKRESLGKISKQEAEAKRKKIEYELAYVPTDKGKPKINFVDFEYLSINSILQAYNNLSVSKLSVILKNEMEGFLYMLIKENKNIIFLICKS